MKQETVVSWLEKEFVKLEQTIGVHGKMYELLEQANKMFEQQIMDAYETSHVSMMTSEQYYNETYGK